MSLQWSEDGLGGRNVTTPLKFKISVAQLHSKKWSLNMWQRNVHIYVHFCFQTKYRSQGFALGMCIFQGLQGYVSTQQPPIMEDPEALLV